MEFLTLDPESFTYGVARPVAPLVRGLIAHNPSKFTYHGTGTYIVGERDVVVIDPGPKLDSHRDALHAALEGCTVRAILVTHCHSDHSPLSAWLAAETGAPTVAFGPHEDDRWDIGPDPMELDVPEAGSGEPHRSGDRGRDRRCDRRDGGRGRDRGVDRPGVRAGDRRDDRRPASPPPMAGR